MKVKDDYVLRRVADVWVVLPLGAASLDFNGMLSLNETAAFLWNILNEGADYSSLVNALVSEYKIDFAQAMDDVSDFVESLSAMGCLED